MELIINEVKFFISALQSIESVNYECKLKLSETGIKIMGMGPSRISLFDFKMGKIEDGEYFGMDLSDLGKILKRVTSAKELTLSLDKIERTLKLIAEIGDKTKTFSLQEIDVGIDIFPVKKLMSLGYLKVIKMPTSELTSILEDCLLYSGTVDIGMKNNKLIFSSYGNVGDAKIEKEIEGTSPNFLSSYGTELVLSKVKEMKGFDVDIVLGNDLPIYLNYELPDGYLKIFIGPKVEEAD